MAIFHRSSHAGVGSVAGSGRAGECALELGVLEHESSSVTLVQPAMLFAWLERLAFAGMLTLLAFVGIGVVMAHGGLR